MLRGQKWRAVQTGASDFATWRDPTIEARPQYRAAPGIRKAGVWEGDMCHQAEMKGNDVANGAERVDQSGNAMWHWSKLVDHRLEGKVENMKPWKNNIFQKSDYRANF